MHKTRYRCQTMGIIGIECSVQYFNSVLNQVLGWETPPGSMLYTKKARLRDPKSNIVLWGRGHLEMVRAKNCSRYLKCLVNVPEPPCESQCGLSCEIVYVLVALRHLWCCHHAMSCRTREKQIQPGSRSSVFE